MFGSFNSKATKLLLLSCTALAFSASGAAAQTINYGSLEQMFGEPVTTSATGKPQTVSDAPANMIIITAEDIRRSGAVTIADVPGRVLQNYAGIDVQQASLGSANVGINGYDQPYSPKLLVLVNGRQVYLDDYGYTEWATIPVELAEIRQIEVVKGPASALFGFNAVNGAINIVTYSPLYDTVREVTAAGGSGNYAGGSAVLTGHIVDDVGLRLSTGAYGGDEFDGWKRSGANYAKRPDRFSVSADSLAKIGAHTVAGIELTSTSSQQTDIVTGNGASDNFYRTWSAKGSLTSETPIGVISGQVYHNAAHTSVDGLAVSGGLDNSTTVAQLSDLLQITPAQTVRESIEYRHNSMSSEQLTNGGTTSYDVIADSLMWDWQILPTLSWTNAGRVDHLSLSRSGATLSGFNRDNSYYDHSLTAYSYNSGLVDKVTDEDSVRVAIGQAIQAPSLLDFGTFQEAMRGGKTYVVAGEASLKPTLVKKYEAGYTRTMPEYGVTLSSSVYYQKTDEMNALLAPYALNASTVLTTDGNVGSSDERGFEASVGYKTKSGVALDANYTLANIREKLNGDYPLAEEKGTPTNKVNLHAGYTIGSLELDAYGHYVSHIYQQTINGGTGSTQLTGVPGYFELDARVAYHLTNSVTAALSASSIDVAHHQEDTGAAVDHRVMGTIGVKF